MKLSSEQLQRYALLALTDDNAPRKIYGECGHDEDALWEVADHILSLTGGEGYLREYPEWKQKNAVINLLELRRVRRDNDFIWTAEKKKRFRDVSDILADSCEKAWAEAVSAADMLQSRIDQNDPYINNYEIEISVMPYFINPRSFYEDEDDYEHAPEFFAGVLSSIASISCWYYCTEEFRERIFPPLFVDKSKNWNEGRLRGEFENGHICYALHRLLESGVWSYEDILAIKFVWTDVKVTRQNQSVLRFEKNGAAYMPDSKGIPSAELFSLLLSKAAEKEEKETDINRPETINISNRNTELSMTIPTDTEEVDLYCEHLTDEDIAPLKYCTNLRKLNLGYNEIRDFSILANFPLLTELSLEFTYLDDLAPLLGLKNLTRLDLTMAGICDFSPLAALPRLTELYIPFSGLSDEHIATLAGLTQLKKLDLRSNYRFTDVTPLAGLTNLESLDLSGNKIRDVTPLARLKNLKELKLCNNKIRDITPLESLMISTDIYMYGNPGFPGYREKPDIDPDDDGVVII